MADTRKCDNCAKHTRRCWIPHHDHPDIVKRKTKQLEAVKQRKRKMVEKYASKRGTRAAVRFRGVHSSKKCMRCLKRKAGCNGKIPCQRCLDGGYPCISQETAAKPPCRECKRTSKGKRCDRKGPCNVCVAAGKNCAYIVQQGLMEKFYPVTKAAKDKFESCSEDKCRWCIVSAGGRCNAEQPCRFCVRVCINRGTRCIYRRDDHLEKYSASAFTIDSSGQVVLKDN